MVAEYKDKLAVKGNLGSSTGQKAAPDLDVSFFAYPGTMFSSKHHYAVYMIGTTPLTSRISQPALIDASTGELTDMRPMPWYLNTIYLSQPFHFGDYGGIPLKILWAVST